jgi:hypothetical protein
MRRARFYALRRFICAARVSMRRARLYAPRASLRAAHSISGGWAGHMMHPELLPILPRKQRAVQMKIFG